MTLSAHVLRYAAFTSVPQGGNPAGVVLDASELSETQMQDIAAEVGYAETVFITEPMVRGEVRRNRVRYFSPIAEVPFCGHATIALAVALSHYDGAGRFVFETPVGEVPIETVAHGDETIASFTSVDPRVTDFSPPVLDSLLRVLGLSHTELDPRYPPRVSYAGNWHPILVLNDSHVFDSFSFNAAALRALMDAQYWTGTVTVLHALGTHEFVARNLFPVGVISEDPATGSAAASLGGYLRELSLVPLPARVLVHQGQHVGRPSELKIDIPTAGGMIVRGACVELA